MRIRTRAPREVGRRLSLALAAAAAAVSLTGCEDAGQIGDPDAGPTTLVVSPTWIGGTDEDVEARLVSLERAIDALRAETGSGWTGRQDDQTGYLAELSGGGYAADDGDAADVARSLLDAHGSDLFGVTAADLTVPDAEPTQTGTAHLRAAQVVDGVPVVDGVLVFSIGSADTEPRVTAVRGRVFPDLDVATEPRVRASAARRTAERLSGGSVQGPPKLVVLPVGTGRLVWEVQVAGIEKSAGQAAFADGVYYLDADSGELVSLRPASITGRTLLPLGVRRPRGAVVVPLPARPSVRTGAAEGEVVEVSGVGPNGDPLTAFGLATPQGTLLKDITAPFYDPASDRGAIQTFDMQGSDNTALLPGKPYLERGGTTISDPEALASQSVSAAVIDYYLEVFGRTGWDGQGGTLVASVNGGDGNFCNSYFYSGGSNPQMFFGNPCAPGGEPAELTEVEIDTAAHEITHGVTGTTARLIYSGQSGALNEAFSDYLGNVIGNAYQGTEGAEIFENSCEGFTEETLICVINPDGTISMRYLLDGTTYDDYLRVLNPGYHLWALTGEDQDNGGVHLNSSIWNNALWTARTRLAQIDGVGGNESPSAAALDAAVFDALTNRLTPTSGFVDARAAVEQAIVDSGADPVVLQVAQEVFDQNRICAGCDAVSTPALGVATSPETQVSPVVHGDRVAWVGLGGGFLGTASSAQVGGTGSSLGDGATTAQVAFAGDALLTLDLAGRVVRRDGAGETVLDQDTSEITTLAGLMGSDDGATWLSGQDGTISFVDPAGTVTSTPLTPLGGDEVWGLGTGGGTVGLGTERGAVWAWQPGSDPVRLGEMPSPVISVAAHGDRVMAVTEAGEVGLFDLAGNRTDLATGAIPFGAAMNADYAVYVSKTTSLGGGVAETSGADFPDTDLRLYSLATGVTYSLLDQRGQQGFPALSGNRLVWQDAVLGGDDILTATIPPGL